MQKLLILGNGSKAIIVLEITNSGDKYGIGVAFS